MSRQETQSVLLFVLVVMVCGGGCMSSRFLPHQQIGLSHIGVDDQTRARLEGKADTPDQGPQPETGLQGKLLIIHLYGIKPRSYGVHA